MAKGIDWAALTADVDLGQLNAHHSMHVEGLAERISRLRHLQQDAAMLAAELAQEGRPFESWRVESVCEDLELEIRSLKGV